MESIIHANMHAYDHTSFTSVVDGGEQNYLGGGQIKADVKRLQLELEHQTMMRNGVKTNEQETTQRFHEQLSEQQQNTERMHESRVPHS